MNVLDFTGPKFLAFFIVTLAMAWVGANAIRALLRRSSYEVPLTQLALLRPVEVAYLAGGMERALEAVVSAMAQRKLVEVDARRTHDQAHRAAAARRGCDREARSGYSVPLRAPSRMRSSVRAPSSSRCGKS